MMALTYKSKQYGLIALKVLILSLTFGYIYTKITSEDGISLSEFASRIQAEKTGYLLLFLMFAVANWSLEILKWSTVIAPLKKLSFSEAAKQSLAALTVSLATPNRIGDYGAKACFYRTEDRKTVLLLNFLSHGSQLLVTLVLGVFGVIVIATRYDWTLSVPKIIIASMVLVFLGITGVLFKEKQLFIKGLSLGKVIRYIRKLPMRIKVRTLLYSLTRYVIFSSLFFGLLRFFGAEITIGDALPLILAMYFLASLIPTLFLFDVVLRGGIALGLFHLAGIPEWPVLATVLAMWLLNFVLPAIWGSYYVISYRRL